jgi:peptide/nickel transport system permease protein
MVKFIARRLLMMIPVLLGVTFIVFSMLYFSPGDAADAILGSVATPEDRQKFNEQHGLDKPFLIQYLRYMRAMVFEGDLGTSYATKQPVMTEILDRFPTTLALAAMSVLIASVIGVVVGVVSATRQYTLIDSVFTSLSMVGVSMPSYWQGMMLIILFAVALRWLPPSGFTTPLHWIMPAFTLGTNSSANIMRMTRSSMLEIIRQDYIRTARAKGLTETVVIARHALKNALIPIITVIGLSLGRLLGGAVLIESIFSISGLGKLMVDSIKLKNSPVVQGGVLFIAIVMSFMNLVVDVLYSFADPRIRSMYIRPRRMNLAVEQETV